MAIRSATDSSFTMPFSAAQGVDDELFGVDAWYDDPTLTESLISSTIKIRE
jgi:hypothetical protein